MNPESRVLITGAAGGIGGAVAVRLQQGGVRVFVSDLQPEAVERTCAGLRELGGPDPAGRACDVRSPESCRTLLEDAAGRLGGLDAVVHCAGILRAPGSRPRPLHDLSDEEFAAVIDINLRGTFLINRAALSIMLTQRAGQILNVSSTSGRRGRPLDSVYSASKAGVIALSESIAEEVRPCGIRVQVVIPDAVDTPLWEQNAAGAKAPAGALSPAHVAEVIDTCLSLPSGAALENIVIMPFRRRRGRAGGETT